MPASDRSELAANVLDRQFNVSAQNRSCVADFTYIWTSEGWLYVAVVLDLFSRRIMRDACLQHDGWSMRTQMTADLVTDALTMALGGVASRVNCCITPIAAANIRVSNASG